MRLIAHLKPSRPTILPPVEFMSCCGGNPTKPWTGWEAFMYAAWGDESASCERRDPGTYMMAAILSEFRAISHLRDAMRSLLLKGQRKVHWHAESSDRRLKLVDAVADMPIEGLVVVRSSGGLDRIERRRRKCLEQLFRELDCMGCAHLVLEPRGPADDKRDHQMMQHMRRRKEVSSGLRLAHEPGPKDPMLWIPDIFCGAVSQARVGEPKYLERISSRVTVQVIKTTDLFS
ncbi:hypothetical protein [Sphaerisporangium aureirubrum]|uniref:hypothetical protein n=1 Tax=Sphaerisporangium aureirubrum TaxID=1544736 RepID=UPI0036D219F5